MSQLHFKYKFWIEDQDGMSILGDGKYRLLKVIEETGSLKHAVAKLNLSYRKTWDKLRNIERKLGYPILETQQGGPSGGTTTLTENARKLMEAFEKLHRECDPYFKELSKRFQARTAQQQSKLTIPLTIAIYMFTDGWELTSELHIFATRIM